MNLKNIKELLKNPQIQELLKDKDAIKDILILQKQIIKENINTPVSDTEETESPDPHVITIEKE